MYKINRKRENKKETIIFAHKKNNTNKSKMNESTEQLLCSELTSVNVETVTDSNHNWHEKVKNKNGKKTRGEFVNVNAIRMKEGRGNGV